MKGLFSSSVKATANMVLRFEGVGCGHAETFQRFVRGFFYLFAEGVVAKSLQAQ